ncbi:MAG: ANTAR domain-containing protein [Bacillota bacterium]
MPASRVVIADSDANFRRKLKDFLRHAGYTLIREAAEGKSALQIVFQTEPDIVILEDKIPGSEGMDIAEIIGEHQVAPVVLAVEINPLAMEDLARKTGVYGILAKPLQETNILPVLEMAMANFERVTRLQKEVKDLRKQLETRKVVEQAKGLLMEKRGFSEQEAYKYLQKISMDRCVPMAKVARQVILALASNLAPKT